MANVFRTKRSAVPSKVPLTTDLQLGEIAINTYDGKMYIKKDVSGTESVVQVGSISGGGDLLASNNLADLSNISTARTNLGLAIGTNVQAYDAGLQSIAGLTTAADRMIYTTANDTYAVTTLTAFGRSILDDTDAAAVRTTLGLTIGTNVQAYDAELAAISALASAADRLPYFTGSGTAALATFTAAGRALVDDADAAAQRTTLGLGTAATRNTGTSGSNIPTFDASGTWSATQVFNGETYFALPFQSYNGAWRANLGSPTIWDAALYDAQFSNKIRHYPEANVIFEITEDGTNWTTFTVTSEQKKRFVAGADAKNRADITIPRTAVKFRVRIVSDGNYVYLNTAYFYASTQGNTIAAEVWKKSFTTGLWEQHTSDTTQRSSWPGHFSLNFSAIPFRTGQHYTEVYILLTPVWAHASNTIQLYSLEMHGGYPAGRRTIYTVDENKLVEFPAGVTSTAFTENGVLLSSKYAALSHTHTMSQITDMSAFGRTLVDDADASAARTTLGLANLATTTASAFALTILDDADGAAVRTTIGAAATSHTHATSDITSGTFADARIAASNVTQHNSVIAPTWANVSSKPSTFAPAAHDASLVTSGVFDIARIPVVPSQVQVLSSGNIAALTSPQQTSIGQGTVVTTTDGRRWIYSGAGSKVLEASYVEIADITPEWSVVANKPSTFTPSAHTHTLSEISDMSAYGRTLVDDADAAAARTTLGLGTAAVVNTGTSGATIPLLNGTNTFSALTTITSPGNAAFGTALELKTVSGTDDPVLAFENFNAGAPVRYGISVTDAGALSFNSGGYSGAFGTSRMTLSSAGALTVSDTVTAARLQVGTFLMDDDIGLGAGIPGFSFDSNDWLAYYRSTNRFEVGIGSVNAFSVTGSGATILGNTVWHAGNDGSGTGLDADTVDGVQLTGLVQQNLYGSFQSSFTSNINANTNRNVGAYGSYASSATNTPTGSGVLLNFTSGSDGSGDGTQFWQDYAANNLYHRQRWGGTWGAWGQIWTSGNDGSGSGLDADTVDGIQASAFAQLASPTFTGTVTLPGAIKLSTTWQAGSLAYTDANWGMLNRPPVAGALGAHRWDKFDGTNIMTITEGGALSVLTSLRVGSASAVATGQLDVTHASGDRRHLFRDGRIDAVNAANSLWADMSLSGGTFQFGIAGGSAKLSVDSSGNTTVAGLLGVNINPNAPVAVRAQTSDSSAIATASGGLATIEVLGNAGAAKIALHRPGAFAGYFGLDTDNKLKWGGWSLGAAAYPVILGGYGSNDTTLTIGTATTSTTGTIRTRKTGDNIEWGHTTAAYHNTLGTEAGSGAGNLIFQGMNGTTSNTYKTTGVKASIIKSDNAGGFQFGTVSSVNADNQTFIRRFEFDSGGSTSIRGISTETQSFYIGIGRSGNGNSGLYLVGDATYSSWGTTLYRDAGGPNTETWLRHRGTGGFYIDAVDAGFIAHRTNGSNRLTIDSAGAVTIPGGIYGSNWFRSNGATGWYNEAYGGGVWMEDTTWVKVYASKSLYVGNSIAATGNITAYYSDDRFKTRVDSLDNALNKVCELTGFVYTENELARSLGYTSDKRQIGLSAQEVQKVLPEAVSLAPVDMETSEFTGEITSKSGENYLTVDYARLVPLLVEAIKELKEEIAELKKAR